MAESVVVLANGGRTSVVVERLSFTVRTAQKVPFLRIASLLT
jgi:hypothetical protein